MREIIFRGKIIELCEYQGQWLEGFYAVENGKLFIAIPKENSLNGFYCDPETVGQYTGLKDLHGTRIFEGDVVRLQNLKRLYEVYWNKKEARYKARNGGCVSPLCNGYNVFVEEVVGNVFDNPELLKGSAKNE